MPERVRKIQTAFVAGELSPGMLMRRDTKQYANGAQHLQNYRLFVGGGATRRPGSWWIGTVPSPGRLIPFTFNLSTRYILVFVAGAMYAFTDAGVAAGSVTGAPWTLDAVQNATWAQAGNTLFLVHPSMPPQVITRTGASSWTVANFAFQSRGSIVDQPYYKIAPEAVTLTPSAVTGAITLTTSAAWWVAGHVGQIVRYNQNQVLITGVTSSTVAQGTVIEELPGSQTLTVASAAGFYVGDSVTGSTSGATGTVTAAGGTSISVYLADKLTAFTTSDVLSGPATTTTISGVASASPAPITVWDEALFNSVNGYPAAVCLHDDRLCFAGHAAVPNALMCSVSSNYYDFNVGTGADNDSVFDFIGDSPSLQINQLVPAEQLILLTSYGPYYVPENYFNTFKPSNIAFYPFGGRFPVATVPRAERFDDGVIFVSGSLVMKARPTGGITRMWIAGGLSMISAHLFNTPVDAGFTYNYDNGPESYGLFVNTDGTMVAMQSIDTEDLHNFTPWTIEGTILSVACLTSTAWMLTERVIGGTTTYILEQFDQSISVDAATAYTSSTLATLPDRYGSESDVYVLQGTWNLGTYPVPAEFLSGGPYVAGLDYTTLLQTMPPEVEVRGPSTGQYKRIARVQVYTLNSSTFAVSSIDGGYALTAYQTTDDLSQPPPPKNGPQDFRLLGWTRDPTLTITQNDPLPLTILGVTMEIAV